MLRCWDEVPSSRPNFTELCRITHDLREHFEARNTSHRQVANHPASTEARHNLDNLSPLQRRSCSDLSSSSTPVNSELCCHCAGHTTAATAAAAAESSSQYCQCSSLSLDRSTMYVNAAAMEEWEMGRQQHQQRKLFCEDYNEYANYTMHQSLYHFPKHLAPEQQQQEEQSTSMPYLPVIFSSRDYLPIVRNRHSLPHILSTTTLDPRLTESVCSLCKCSQIADTNSSMQQVIEDQMEGEDILHHASSFESICSNCHNEMFGGSPSTSQQDSVQVYQNTHPVEKPKVELQISNVSSDSGVVTATSDDHTFDFNVNGVMEDRVEKEIAGCVSAAAVLTSSSEGAEERKEVLKEEDSHHITAAAAPRHHHKRLSAHPRFRALFEKLGINESEV